ncbi:MAG: copper homeostasis protein CutC, partial [Bacteroidota bacterium]|nr:copper homeostasis protein CutC [Bacteroidota bacterium]
MTIEICCGNLESAINAEAAGADRIELCAELAVGGITPSYGLIAEVVKQLSIPVFVLIRPRSGDFTYSDTEFEAMKKDIQICQKLGCSGIVSGILLENSEIDIPRTEELIRISKPLAFTFHRAFDWVPDPLQSLLQLEKMGVNRVLTSGQQPKASQGLNLLKELKNSAESITILPGAGITAENAGLFKNAGFYEIHSTATQFQSQIFNKNVPMNSLKHLAEEQRAVSNLQQIKALI